MSYRVALRKNDTGEIRFVEMPGFEWGDGAEFYWTEGNYACDCNRALEWHRVNGEPDPDIACGSTAYTALYAELPDGRRITIDDESPERR